ncbi:Uncharacterised protein [uncultured archaeon]|nr:Uncharacterised protein [uncultured archaeon]
MEKNKIFVLLALSFVVMLRLVSAADNYNVEVTDVSPTSLTPGEQTELSFKIENTGNVDLDNIVFSWEEKTGSILPVGSSNTQSTDSLGEGDDEEFNFDVFTSASASPGLYGLTLTIKFNNDNGTAITETSNVGIIVGGQTDFDISISDSSSTGTILSVANIGKNPAESVTIIIPEQSNFKTSGSSSSIIGNLDKGDYSVASFQLVSYSSSSSLNVEIQYTDTTGTRQTLTKTVEIPSSSLGTQVSASPSTSSTTGYAAKNTSQNSNTFLIIGFVVSILFTIGIIIFIIKKNKNKNETN